MELISHLFQFLSNFWENLLPFVIVKEYEHGVILRIGKYKDKVGAGIVWKIPFLDSVILCHNTITTVPVKSQSLTTKDEKNVVLSAIVKYKITNPKTFLLEVEDAIDAINDITQSKIKELITHKTWDEIRDLSDSDIKDLVELEVKQWGIKIYYITITDLALIRTIRLMNSND